MIYYFSGTGNTKYAALKIARSEKDAALYAPDVITGRAIIPLEGKNDAIGFVFPTYFYGVPVIVEDLLDALELTEVHGRYIYLVLTCGSATGNASRVFAKLLKARGCSLSACFSVRMVDNYIPMFRISDQKTIDRRLAEADDSIASICEYIHNRETGDFDGCRGGGAAIMTSLSYPVYLNGRKTKGFEASPRKCTGCVRCALECPVDAITIKDGLPEWKAERCVFCLHCIHYCPTEAIEYGKKTRGKGRYRNPRIG